MCIRDRYRSTRRQVFFIIIRGADIFSKIINVSFSTTIPSLPTRLPTATLSCHHQSEFNPIFIKFRTDNISISNCTTYIANASVFGIISRLTKFIHPIITKNVNGTFLIIILTINRIFDAILS